MKGLCTVGEFTVVTGNKLIGFYIWSLLCYNNYYYYYYYWMKGEFGVVTGNKLAGFYIWSLLCYNNYYYCDYYYYYYWMKGLCTEGEFIVVTVNNYD
jgi:hypothetical protein